MRFLFAPLLASLLISQLTGCSPFNNKPVQDSWTLSGKIGITTPKESMAGFIRWQQQQDNFDIYVSGPLGQGSTRIQGNPQQATLTQGGKTSESLAGFSPWRTCPFGFKANKPRSVPHTPPIKMAS